MMAQFTDTVTRTVNCPYCHDSRVVKNGKGTDGKQRYMCKPCGKRFLDTRAVHGRKNPSNHVGAAISLFYRGMSYKQLAEAIAEMYDIPEPSSARFSPGPPKGCSHVGQTRDVRQGRETVRA